MSAGGFGRAFWMSQAVAAGRRDGLRRRLASCDEAAAIWLRDHGPMRADPARLDAEIAFIRAYQAARVSG